MSVTNLALQLESLVAASGSPGAVVAIRRYNQSRVIACGTARLSGGSRLAPDAVFPLYSITKTYIAILMMQLLDEGRIDLDQSVRSLLDRPGLVPQITLRHLLSHTSGLGDYGGAPAYVADLRRNPGLPWSATLFVDYVVGIGPRFAPGQGWQYANVGYLLLGQVIHAITGFSLQQAVLSRIAAPLGLLRTTVVESLADLREVAPGYSRYLTEAAWEDVRDLYHPGWVSHGLVAAPAGEVAVVLDAVFRQGLVSESSWLAMITGVDVGATDPFIKLPRYGLGLMIDGDQSRGVVAGHNGGGPGWNTSAMYFASVNGSPTTIVALSNSDESLAAKLVFHAREALDGQGL